MHREKVCIGESNFEIRIKWRRVRVVEGVPMHREKVCIGESNFEIRIIWRRVRVVEGARLESVYRGNSIKGSNPFVSA